MKVLLVGCFDIMMHPYAQKYIQILQSLNIQYRFIYWNRSDSNAVDDENYVPFTYQMNTYSGRKNKLKGYCAYSKFVRHYIKHNHFDKIIFFATQTMVFFSDIALLQYKNKYIFDYRDETYEKWLPYHMLVKKCIKSSSICVVSSLGFLRKYHSIDDQKFVLCHNTKHNFKSCNIEKYHSEKIRLSFWGQVRLESYFLKLIKVFENDDRFIISFHGEGNTSQLVQYVEENNISNVIFTGRYQQNEILNFAKNTDFMINCYPNDSYQKNALTVRMYEAIMYNIPMIVQKGSFMQEYLGSYQYPYVEIDLDKDTDLDDIKQKLLKYDYISNITIIDQIRKDEARFADRIQTFLRKD